jgi:hypothetical protein
VVWYSSCKNDGYVVSQNESSSASKACQFLKSYSAYSDTQGK